ncbi:MATE family efflux transporter [Patulibacter sp.]|uniref:MATE family efflux transporter n=1 Tax=Patulibacter sp. TaxID=1912859 RepID=UPI002728BC90|nr:MATE family efflux transporter [Patulibacter sp.]MDO9409330.1 MATE family efflux transporter [Patulibacter sp.]
MPALRSPHDREILRLALPALVTLAAEPTYLLVDTAMVGHLGVAPLAALALAVSVLGTITGLGVVATYATTAAVARLSGAGQDEDLRALASQALWLGAGVGATGAVVVVALGPLWIDALGGTGDTADDAARYLRIAAPGLALALASMAAQGWMRGTGDLRTPLKIVLLGNAINVVLNPILIYGAGLGLDGSAIATLVGQLTMGALFVRVLWRAGAAPGVGGTAAEVPSAAPGRAAGDDGSPAGSAPRGAAGPVDRRPSLVLLRHLGSTGGFLLVRTGALLLTFAVASAVAARIDEPSLAAHQIGWQLFLFLALVLDAAAIAGQVLIGRALGAGRVDEALEASRRMVLLTVTVGVLAAIVLFALRGAIIGAFTGDAAVRDRALDLWPVLCAMLPFAAAVFAFDGILIGAGDARYLAGAMVAAAVVGLPAMVLLREAGAGIAGVWGGIVVVMAARLAATWWRWRGGRWATPGAWRT